MTASLEGVSGQQHATAKLHPRQRPYYLSYIMYISFVYSQLSISTKTAVSLFFRQVLVCLKLQKCTEMLQNKEAQNEASCESLGLASMLRTYKETSNETLIFRKDFIK